MDAWEPDRKKQRSIVTENGDNGVNCLSYHTSDGCPLGDACQYRQPTSIENGTGVCISVGGSVRNKPCLKFFSTSGCPYGEGCHFSHYLSGGLSSFALPGFGAGGVGKLLGGLNMPNFPTISLPTPDPGPNLGGYKTRICNRYSTSEGCRFGDRCHFAHGEGELQKSDSAIPVSDLESLASLDYLKGNNVSAVTTRGSQDNASRIHVTGGLTFREPTPPGMGAASFGASSTAKVSIDANLAGAIIGRGGTNAKQICRLSGARLSIREHETDPNLRNIEMEGSFDQIKLASQMVRELLMHKDTQPPPRPPGFGPHSYKTKMCENFPKGMCTFGDRCHFAHGDSELREPSVGV